MNYSVVVIKEIQKLFLHQDIIVEAYEVFRKKVNYEITLDAFYKVLMNIIGSDEHGAIFLFNNKNGKTVGFAAAYDGTVSYGAKSMFVYCAYANPKDANVFGFMVSWFSRWCKEHGFVSFAMQTRRSSGAAIRCFEEKYGFKKSAVIFTKEV
jgi:hypothetical protein